MNNVDKQYQQILNDILNHGYKKKNRTACDTLSVFNREIRHKMSEGFPLLTTKRVPFKTVGRELMWFLSGSTNIQPLVKKGIYIWVGDAYKRYNRVWDIESRESVSRHHNRLWDLHMLKDMTEEEFIEEIKTNDKFAEKWGELGPIYGFQWRRWGETEDKDGVDQIAALLDKLQNDPYSRRLIVNAWNVSDLLHYENVSDDELYERYLKSFD